MIKKTARAKKAKAKKSSAKTASAHKPTAKATAKKSPVRKQTAKKATSRKTAKRSGQTSKSTANSAGAKLANATSAPQANTATQPKAKQTSTALPKGLQSLGTVFQDYAKEQIEDTMATTQQLLACRSFEDFAAVQKQFVQQSFDRLVKRANTLTQSAASMAKDASGPLNEKMENFKKRFYNAA